MKRGVWAAIAAAGLIIPLIGASQEFGEYLGLDTCADCHADVAESYGATPHANSLEVLEAAGSASDPECLACHTTGLEDSKYVDGAVTCEACHGPGSGHVVAGEIEAIKSEIGEADCLKCHTAEWSPDFDYETYRAKGVHGGG